MIFLNRAAFGVRSGQKLSAMSNDGADGGSKLCSVDFEIFGHVQGVCFRMYSEEEGLRLGLVGWVRNTHSGTVEGQMQGPPEQIREMATSPQSTCPTKPSPDVYRRPSMKAREEGVVE
ncbi:acylphosphatase-2-like isoform X3 [Conger conger]|uniref:acylphosphatase-2-like isoform X3 n=1 Tax=Conger conger TaxID=82655 RepID=UPI002A598EB7|nr:acylphosphatase-2-like isoform X3 [Conger conger]